MDLGLTRRRFLEVSAVALGTTALRGYQMTPTRPAKYTRHSVTSAGGKKALASYARGIDAMLKLPPDNPHNWFRNAFVHLMDCPHGNWWFLPWHRGYLGYLEQTIRTLSGDATFALPYWDWTLQPQVPDPLFDGALAPGSAAFAKYTNNLAVFTSFIQPTLSSFWKALSQPQLAQLTTRGYTSFDVFWNSVTGYDPTIQDGYTSGVTWANPSGARYLSRDNPKLDDRTAYDVSPFVVYSGLSVTAFYSDSSGSFSSSKTPSHNSPPDENTVFSTIEGLPHNNVHNCISGVGPIDPGPYGYMANFLSPVDPIFFLHHANIDRLWDVWTRKQQARGLPYLPAGADLDTLSNEPFLFFTDVDGNAVINGKAGDSLAVDRFEYSYEPGFGEEVVNVNAPQPAVTPLTRAPIQGVVAGNTATLAVPSDAIRAHLGAAQAASLFVDVTLPRTPQTMAVREFDVIVGAPATVATAGPGSPYYAGTIAFFGTMMNMAAAAPNATFSVPLPTRPEAFAGLPPAGALSVTIRVVPSHGRGGTPASISAARVRVR